MSKFSMLIKGEIICIISIAILQQDTGYHSKLS